MTPRPFARLSAALIAAAAATILVSGVALAHPESEGEHAGCIVTAEPGTVPAGGEFTVAGNFGGASIFVLPGADAVVGEDATPDATVPVGEESFAVTFTAQGSPGELTIWAFIEGSECGDSDHITVTALPDTAMEAPSSTAMGGAIVLLAAAAAAAAYAGIRIVAARL
jgi:hypothetical protein